MGKMSRDKGRSGEAELERIISERGFDVDRNIGGRIQQRGDISLTTEGLAVEGRRRERVNLTSWALEHAAQTPSHVTPVVATRRNREPWVAALLLDDLLDLLEEARK